MSTPELEPFDVLVGRWDLEITHPTFEGVVRGEATFEWLEGQAFLIQRSSNEHPDAPDSITIIGPGPDGLQADYFDSRGVRRVYACSLRDRELRMWRAVPGFSQRFLGTFSADRSEIDGGWDLSLDDATWNEDLGVRFLRRQA